MTIPDITSSKEELRLAALQLLEQSDASGFEAVFRSRLVAQAQVLATLALSAPEPTIENVSEDDGVFTIPGFALRTRVRYIGPQVVLKGKLAYVAGYSTGEKPYTIAIRNHGTMGVSADEIELWPTKQEFTVGDAVRYIGAERYQGKIGHVTMVNSSRLPIKVELEGVTPLWVREDELERYPASAFHPWPNGTKVHYVGQVDRMRGVSGRIESFSGSSYRVRQTNGGIWFIPQTDVVRIES